MLQETKLKHHIAKHLPSGTRRRALQTIQSALILCREYRLPRKYDHASDTTKAIINKEGVGRYSKKDQVEILVSAISRAFQEATNYPCEISGTLEGIKTTYEKFAIPIINGEGFGQPKIHLRRHLKLIKKHI